MASGREVSLSLRMWFLAKIQAGGTLEDMKVLLRIVEQAAGHLRWEVDYPPSQPVGSGFEPHWRPQPAKLPSFGYSLENLPYLLFWIISCLTAFSHVTCYLRP